MRYEEFRIWLKSNKGFSVRSSNDVISRLKRSMSLSGVKSVDSTTVAFLESSDEFKKISMSVKSQLRRSLLLYNEFLSGVDTND